jgi:hypothetical protein
VGQLEGNKNANPALRIDDHLEHADLDPWLDSERAFVAF